jgi:toxin ParE1/3/4
MAKRRVEFHEEASHELEAAFDWYLERSESAAERFLTDLNSATANVAEAPQRWPPSKYGTRKFLLTRFPFAIIYRELPSFIQIVAVAHGRRRPGYWKNRF